MARNITSSRWLMLMAVSLLLAACGDGSGAGMELQGADTTTGETVAVEVDGKAFVDPQGTYTITIGSDWVQQPGAFVKEIESWAIAEPADGFGSNVNVLTQDAPGTSLAEYLELSLKSMGELDVIEQRIITGSNGNDLGMIEYEGVIPGLADDRSLHFLATFDVRDGVAVVATLTTVNDATFDALRPIVEPFLRSLQAT